MNIVGFFPNLWKTVKFISCRSYIISGTFKSCSVTHLILQLDYTPYPVCHQYLPHGLLWVIYLLCYVNVLHQNSKNLVRMYIEVLGRCHFRLTDRQGSHGVMGSELWNFSIRRGLRLLFYHQHWEVYGQFKEGLQVLGGASKGHSFWSGQYIQCSLMWRSCLLLILGELRIDWYGLWVLGQELKLNPWHTFLSPLDTVQFYFLTSFLRYNTYHTIPLFEVYKVNGF